MDLNEAARQAVVALSGPEAAWGELDRAREILHLVGDGQGARRTAIRMGDLAAVQAKERDEAGDAGGALSAWFDAATAYGHAAEGHKAKASADQFLRLWPAFEASKRIDLHPARVEPAKPVRATRLRRLPKGEGRAGPPAALEDANGPVPPGPSVLPSMFLEMHASALKFAGRDAEAKRRFEEAMANVEAEVARRRQAQEWGEALAAARVLLRLALEAGGRARLDAIRPDVIAVAREAAAEALSPDYLARGRQEIPERAMELALLEAHALGNEALAQKYEEEATSVLERTAEILEALSDPRTAAEAVLSWEDAWPVLYTRPDLRRAVLDHPEASAALTGPFAALAGIATSHPLRREVEDFRQRVEEVVKRASTLAPQSLEKAARSLLGLDGVRSRNLALRARNLLEKQGRPAPDSLLALLRDAQQALGDEASARALQQELIERAARVIDPEEGRRRHLVWGAPPVAPATAVGRANPAVAGLASFLIDRGARSLAQGLNSAARLDFEEAALLGQPQASLWLRLLELGGFPRSPA